MKLQNSQRTNDTLKGHIRVTQYHRDEGYAGNMGIATSGA